MAPWGPCTSVFKCMRSVTSNIRYSKVNSKAYCAVNFMYLYLNLKTSNTTGYRRRSLCVFVLTYSSSRPDVSGPRWVGGDAASGGLVQPQRCFPPLLALPVSSHRSKFSLSLCPRGDHFCEVCLLSVRGKSFILFLNSFLVMFFILLQKHKKF